MNYLLSLEFDRKLKPTNANAPPEIHGFSDAGDQAYGAVLFLRWELIDGSFVCVPVMIKAFVAPAKKKSIPRLESLGSLTLARIYDACTKMLTFADIDQAKKFLWIDSTTVLSWIKTPPKEFRPFVSARVAEIQETVGSEDFRYIPSNENPADALTRGLDSERLKDWLTGPSFLKLPEAEWLHSKNQSKPEIDAAETKRELKPQKKQPKDKKVHVNPTVNANTTAETDNPENHSQEKTTESKVEEKVNPRDMIRSTVKRVNDFWCCWMKYFAPNLLPRNKWFRTREKCERRRPCLRVGFKA